MNHTIDQQNEQTEKLGDVAKASLSWYAEQADGRPALGELDNTNAAITAWLDECMVQAQRRGAGGVCALRL
jgi:hypothetical protein